MTTASAGNPAAPCSPIQSFVDDLRRLSRSALGRMYRPQERRFAFRLCCGYEGPRLEGSSDRYTAIALIGLAEESTEAAREVLRGHTRVEVCERLLDAAPSQRNLGDLALTHWASIACGSAPRRDVRERLIEIATAPAHLTIELAWALVALSEDTTGGDAMEAVARRLLAAFDERSDFFPHRLGNSGFVRGHVTSFADQIYPIHALSRYHLASGDDAALRVAARCAARLRTLLGPAGQWWWHYDVRTAQVLEPYPVYAVHQDAMAPMAFFELAEAGGPNHSDAIGRGLDWLRAAPELGGGSLVDEERALIWRKVGRRDPPKLVRGLQALAARLHPALRVPAMDSVFPADAIDEECRPYHFGWLLYAWRASRATRWMSERQP